MDYHPSLSRSQRTRNGGSREPSPSPSPSPFSMTSRSKPRDPNALIAGPAYSNHGGGNSLASPRPAHLQVEELEPPSLRKRLSSGMLGGLFKGSKVQEDSNQPVQRGFVVSRMEIGPASSISSPRPTRSIAHDDLPLFPPGTPERHVGIPPERHAGTPSERQGGTPPPRLNSPFSRNSPQWESSNPSEMSGTSLTPTTSHAQDLFSYIRNCPDPRLTLHMPIFELCRHIRVASTSAPNLPPHSPATSADSSVTWLSWYKETSGVKHEFVTLRVMGINGERDFWMRLDRSAAKGSSFRKILGLGSHGDSRLNFKSVSSIFQANDTVGCMPPFFVHFADDLPYMLILLGYAFRGRRGTIGRRPQSSSTSHVPKSTEAFRP